uniref:Uncharacterized protein n=1 Tax=Oryza meridionalis TaxID=40149 RepID=A0A0E0CNY8_9ORYZ
RVSLTPPLLVSSPALALAWADPHTSRERERADAPPFVLLLPPRRGEHIIRRRRSPSIPASDQGRRRVRPAASAASWFDSIV